jgi:hypothetical protein
MFKAIMGFLSNDVCLSCCFILTSSSSPTFVHPSSTLRCIPFLPFDSHIRVPCYSSTVLLQLKAPLSYPSSASSLANLPFVGQNLHDTGGGGGMGWVGMDMGWFEGRGVN